MLTQLDLPFDVTARDGVVTLRRAVPDDLRALMRLLADDPISAGRGDRDSGVDETAYREALMRVLSSESNDLIVAEDGSGLLIATLQLTLIPGMSRRGSARLLVESVRVASDQRSAGIGSAMMRWVTDAAAPAAGVALVQLTSDAARVDAHRFYRRLGFIDSHVGFKFELTTHSAGAR